MFLYSLMKIADIIHYYPSDLLYNKESAQIIHEESFRIQFKTRCDPDELRTFLSLSTNFDINVKIGSL